MGIGVLGPVTWDGSARLSPRDRVVLAVLATRPGHPVAPDRIADALWGDTPPPTAGKVLQGCIARLRKSMGKEAIETSTQGYALTLASDEIDSMQFELLVTRGRELLTLGESDRAAYLLTQGLSLWRGEAFADVESWPPAADEAKRLGELRLEAQELRVDAHLRAGRHEEVLAQAQALVRAAPLRERRWSLLALAQYQSGAQGEALRTIHQLKSVLARQLGIDPGHEVVALEQAILRQDPSLLSGPALAPSAANCPWQGLKPYGEGDADRFFGRDDDVDSCLEILRRTSLLVLVGPSGCGKSSLLHAGVAATLRGRGRPTVSITPGTHPMQALTALGQARPDTVLLVDQFEELFSLCDALDERQEFLEALTAEVAARTVVLALRADHLADLASSPAFSRLVERGLYLVGGLDERALRQAIEGPARQAGLVIEPGLVDVLVREVKDDPGALPLLSHALLETWKRREGNTLTVAGYQASGGIHDAVAQSAERLYARIEVEQRHLLRDLVLRLVSPGTQGEPVRSRVPRRLIANDPEHDQLIELLVGARLVTSDDGVLEITHEALARAWPRLRGWLDDDIEGQRMLHHLSSSADAWDTLGRPDSELYRGIRLARVLDWQRLSQTALTDTEREFLEMSRRAAEAEERTAVERARTQARLIRRLRGLLAVAAVLLLVAATTGVLAQRNARRATVAATAADARQVGSQALLTSDAPTSLLLAVAAARLDPSAATQADLQSVLAKRPELFRTTLGQGRQFGRLAVSPNGRTIAIRDASGTTWLYDAESFDVIASHRLAHPAALHSAVPIRFSPDGTELAVPDVPSRHPLQLLDSETLMPLADQLGGWPDRVTRVVGISYASRTDRIAVSVDYQSPEGNWFSDLLVWDRARPATPLLRINVSDSQGIAISADGTRVFTSAPFAAYDVDTGHRIARNPAAWSWILLEPSPDSSKLAMLDWGNEGSQLILIVDTRTGDIVQRLSGLRVAPVLAVWSPDGQQVAATSPAGVAMVWDVGSEEVTHSLATDDATTYGVGFSPDGATLYTAGSNHELQAWDLDGYRSFLERVPISGEHGVGGNFIRLSPDGNTFAVEAHTLDRKKMQLHFVDLVKDRTTPVLDLSRSGWFGGGGWSFDSTRYATGFDDSTVEVIDVASNRVVGSQKVGTGLISEIAYADGGRKLVLTQNNGDVYVVDAATLAPVGPPVRFDEPAMEVTTSPLTHTAFVILGGPRPEWYYDPMTEDTSHWALIDVDTREVLRSGQLGMDGTLDSAFSPDGRHVAVAGLQGQLEIIDTRTGESSVGPTSRQSGDLYSVAYSHDGSRLQTLGGDGVVRLWDARTGDQLAALPAGPGHGGGLGGFLPDGTVVLTSGVDGRVWRWDTSLDHAIQFACQAAGRDLTEGEWNQILPNHPYQQVCPGP